VEDVNVQVSDRVLAGAELARLEKTSLPQNIILAEAEQVSAQRALEDLLSSDTARAQAWIALRNAQEAYDKAYDYRDSLNNPIQVTDVRLVTQVVNGVPVRVPKKKTYKADASDEEIEKADANLALKKAQYDDAQRTYDRLKDGPNDDDLSAAQARVDAAQATLNMARITAPFAGTITEANPLPGDQVSAGVQAFRLDNLDRLFVDVQVSEVDINVVTLGQPVSLSFDAILGREYNGEVVQVSQAGTVVQGVVNFTITVELTEFDEDVKPGMTAAVNIVVREIKDAVLIPNRAVRLVDGQRVVYIQKDGMPEKTEIRLGASSDTNSVVVGGDIKEGDLIILNPPIEFQAGGPPGGMR
jgi:HlyD family secretion protein